MLDIHIFTYSFREVSKSILFNHRDTYVDIHLILKTLLKDKNSSLR